MLQCTSCYKFSKLCFERSTHANFTLNTCLADSVDGTLAYCTVVMVFSDV